MKTASPHNARAHPRAPHTHPHVPTPLHPTCLQRQHVVGENDLQHQQHRGLGVAPGLGGGEGQRPQAHRAAGGAHGARRHRAQKEGGEEAVVVRRDARAHLFEFKFFEFGIGLDGREGERGMSGGRRAAGERCQPAARQESGGRERAAAHHAAVVVEAADAGAAGAAVRCARRAPQAARPAVLLERSGIDPAVRPPPRVRPLPPPVLLCCFAGV